MPSVIQNPYFQRHHITHKTPHQDLSATTSQKKSDTQAYSSVHTRAYFGSSVQKVAIRPEVLELPEFFTQKIKRYVDNHSPDSVTPIMLTIGMPDGEPPQSFRDGIIKYANSPNAYQYGTMAPLPNFTNWLKARYDIEIDESQILPYAGSNEGIYQLLREVLDPGENGAIWTPNPGYPTFYTAQELGGWKTVSATGTEKNQFLSAFDFEQEWEELDAQDRDNIKAIILNFPNNPTGTIASEKQLKKAVQFAKSHNLLIISDLAYADIYYPGQTPPKSLFELKESKGAHIIEFHTFSKGLKLPGPRMGMAILSPSLLKPQGEDGKSFYQAMKEIKGHISASGGIPNIFQWAARDMLENISEVERFLEAQRDMYAKRSRFMRQSLESMGWETFGNETNTSPFYLWAKAPGEKSALESVEQLIRETGVAMIPGSCFGKGGENYLRIAMTQPLSILQEASERLQNSSFNVHKS